MTGKSLMLLVDRYRAICSMYGQRPDLEWLLTDFASDERYAAVDILEELRDYKEYWSDRKRSDWPKSHKRSLRNWFVYAVDRVTAAAPERPAAVQTPKPAPVYPRPGEGEAAWQAWLDKIRPEVDPHTFDVWYSKTTGIGLLEIGTVIVRVPNAIFKEWLERNAVVPPFSVQYEHDEEADRGSQTQDRTAPGTAGDPC